MEKQQDEPRSITKSDLVMALWRQNPDLRQSEVKALVSLVFDEIAQALAEGRRAELRGFGSFSVRDRRPRNARNPRTGEAIRVGRKFVPFFRASKGLLDRVNRER